MTKPSKDELERWQILRRPRGWRAYRFAERQLKQHGLKDWTVQIATSRQADGMKRRIGLPDGYCVGGVCLRETKKIGLTPVLMLDYPWPEVEHTVLHEIAHALVGRDGHGKTFLVKCREIMPAEMYERELLAVKRRRKAPQT
jgi:predicted metal-dependent hydrolase